jgi:hypothetical protein
MIYFCYNHLIVFCYSEHTGNHLAFLLRTSFAFFLEVFSFYVSWNMISSVQLREHHSLFLKKYRISTFYLGYDRPFSILHDGQSLTGQVHRAL